MGEQRNLTEENVSELTAVLERQMKDNPDLEYKFFEQEKKQEQPSNMEIFQKLVDIENQLKLIFDGHVLINKTFQKIKP